LHAYIFVRKYTDLIFSFSITDTVRSITSERQYPLFAMKYEVSSNEAPSAGDYNELVIVTKEFFDGYFSSLFEDYSANYAYTTITTYKVRESFVVEYNLLTTFYIPGEVPTIPFLYIMLEKSLESQSSSMEKYLDDLATMSETNPFSTTATIDLIDSRADLNIGPPGQPDLPSGGDTDGKEKTHRAMLPVVIGSGCLALVLASFFWIRRNRDGGGHEDSEKKNIGGQQNLDNESIDEPTVFSGSDYATQPYGDDERLTYVNSANEYSGKGDGSTLSRTISNIEEVSLEYISTAASNCDDSESTYSDDTENQEEVLKTTPPDHKAGDLPNEKKNTAHEESPEADLVSNSIGDLQLEGTDEKEPVASETKGEALTEPKAQEEAPASNPKEQKDVFNYLNLDSSFDVYEDLRED
jgi:hypothetical protein